MLIIGYSLESYGINVMRFYIVSIIRVKEFSVRASFVTNNSIMSGKPTKRLVKKLQMPKMDGDETIDIHADSPSPTAAAAAAVAETETTGFDVEFWPGRRLSLSRFNGRVFIHVRGYSLHNDRAYPTKKGASFTPGRLSVLRGKISEIDEALRQQEVNACYNVVVGDGPLYKAHIGAGIFATVGGDYHGVNLRRHWVPEGKREDVPTKNGIYLPTAQWSALKLKLAELLASHPELRGVTECINTHDNQLEMIECRECMPFGWIA